jgi:hypothetical protein
LILRSRCALFLIETKKAFEHRLVRLSVPLSEQLQRAYQPKIDP